jgi:hypothetical protein
VPRVSLGLAVVLVAIGAATLVHEARFMRGAERATERSSTWKAERPTVISPTTRFFGLWLWPIVFGGLGIGFGAAALFYPRFGPLARRRQRARTA